VRTIKKRQEPEALTQWRARCQADPEGAGINYGYDALRQNEVAIEQVLRALVAEQGGVCAYTGHRITHETAHIEHLKAQKYCERGEDVDYQNMAACWPWPNCGFEAAFGAHPKKIWPSPDEQHFFVTPLSNGCEHRFEFNRHGEITASPDDIAAEKTISKLNLDEHRENRIGIERKLTTWRQKAASGVLGKYQNLKLKDARNRLKALDRDDKELNDGASVTLSPFCFAIRQVLTRHIKKVEAIRAQIA